MANNQAKAAMALVRMVKETFPGGAVLAETELTAAAARTSTATMKGRYAVYIRLTPEVSSKHCIAANCEFPVTRAYFLAFGAVADNDPLY
jgi:hypothetical protein